MSRLSGVLVVAVAALGVGMAGCGDGDTAAPGEVRSERPAADRPGAPRVAESQVRTAPAAAQMTPATSRGGMVATVHPLATDAAVRVLEEGGNAIDAAVAAALMLGVVDGHNSGIGGGCLMMFRTAGSELYLLDGREAAPLAATRDMYIRDGQADTELSQTGPLAVGIPGSLAVYQEALSIAGTRSLADLLAPAADTAEEGFEIDATYASRLRGAADALARFDGSREILLREDGSPLEEGDVLRQPDLARTYRAIAEDGIDHVYNGPFAEAVADWMSANGGIITAEDFAMYEVRPRPPIETTYRGYTIVGFPPPSSGGVHIAQMFHMLERFDIPALHAENPAARVHVMTEAMKLAFADRAHWLGDTDFIGVPVRLLDRAYGRELGARIDPDSVTEVRSHSTPPDHDIRFLNWHTTHIAVADADGNWVALTATLNTAFGSKVIVPGTGVILNNQMDDFSIQPGVPNHFGLIGAEANAIEPRKRPLSSMSPTIVLDQDRQPVMTLGAAGGPTIINQVLLTISNHVDFGDDLPTALSRPRFHHQWSPDELRVEEGFDEETIRRLEAMGHTVRQLPSIGVTQAILRLDDGTFVGMHDPRASGKAAGPENRD